MKSLTAKYLELLSTNHVLNHHFQKGNQRNRWSAVRPSLPWSRFRWNRVRDRFFYRLEI